MAIRWLGYSGAPGCATVNEIRLAFEQLLRDLEMAHCGLATLVPYGTALLLGQITMRLCRLPGDSRTDIARPVVLGNDDLRCLLQFSTA